MAFNLPSLRDRAMTVKVRFMRFRPVMRDRSRTAQIQNKENTRSLRVIKTLLSDCREFKKANAAYEAVRTYIAQNTLPWCDEGVRLLPNSHYLEFAAELGRLRSQADAAVLELYHNWDKCVAEDLAVLGSAAEPSDYPDAETMLLKWGIKIRFSPIPEVDDFRVDVSEEDKKEMEEDFEASANEATNHLLTQLLEPVAKMVEALGKPQTKHGYERTLVTNVTDITARARKLNLNNDARITKICDEADSILKGLTAKDLKQDKELASDVREGMAEVQKKLAGWF